MYMSDTFNPNLAGSKKKIINLFENEYVCVCVSRKSYPSPTPLCVALSGLQQSHKVMEGENERKAKTLTPFPTYHLLNEANTHQGSIFIY